MEVKKLLSWLDFIPSLLTKVHNHQAVLLQLLFQVHVANASGMVIVGLPYAFAGQMGVDEIKGGSPYGTLDCSSQFSPSQVLLLLLEEMVVDNLLM